VPTYRYNGLGQRIMWQYDDDGDQTLESQETFHFMYDERWRIVGIFRNTDTDAKESFVYHAAGKAGFGNASYIDSVILRDKDANTAWTSAGDAVLDERRYYCQNWRADVVALTKSDGQPVEFIRYSSYDRAQAFAAADVNRDGVVNSTDAADWDNLYTEASSNAAIPVDFDFDGAAFDPADNDAFYAAYSEASGWSNGSGGGSLGGKLSRIGNRKGYAEYEFDQPIEGYHVRHRVYLPEIGKWTRRDRLGYIDAMSMYQYCQSMPIAMRDMMGLSGGPLFPILPTIGAREIIPFIPIIGKSIKTLLQTIGSNTPIAGGLVGVTGGLKTPFASIGPYADGYVEVTTNSPTLYIGGLAGFEAKALAGIEAGAGVGVGIIGEDTGSVEGWHYAGGEAGPAVFGFAGDAHGSYLYVGGKMGIGAEGEAVIFWIWIKYYIG